MGKARAKRVKRGLRRFDDRLRDSIEENPVFFIVIALAVLFIQFLWGFIQMLLHGLWFAGLALFVVFVSFLILIRKKHGKPSLGELMRERRKLVDAISIARQRYMKRKLNEEQFNSFFRKKEPRLIEVEAAIRLYQDTAGQEEVEQQVLAVKARKRHLLRELLLEKKRISKEVGIAEKTYLKRKIDAATYQAIVMKNQQRLIELEAEIKNHFREAGVAKVMQELREKIASLEREKRRSKTEKAQKMASDVAEQVSGD